MAKVMRIIFVVVLVLLGWMAFQYAACQNGKKDAKVICATVVNWYSDCMLGNGSFPKSPQERDVNQQRTFEELFPRVADKWENGNQYYEYEVTTTVTDYDGKTVHKVYGYYKGYKNFFGDVIETHTCPK